ncbi:YDG domain-containing protein [Polynucleobacter sp. MWH-Jannik1A5]|uniref:YDG domain-containing protein n=2 Tax=Polynucleobacter sp. MWH-Jannik1A5 TaxID=1855890 RepID=UPI001C0AC7CA|nr:YDG domain-containing protein [Polynucleobacter sp. MWH-Jannik1A5]
MWVIDPITLIIDSAAASAISNALNTTSVTLDATGSACAFGSCTNSQSALIRIMAGADIYSSNTATSLNLIATGGQIDIHSNITAGSVYAVAQSINVYGSVNTNGGSNSNIYLAGAIINILGNINSNGNNQNNSSSSNLNSANTITGANRRNGQNGLTADSNTYSSNGGLINILATGDITVDTNSYISSNGVNGGVVTITSTAGKVTINGIVDSIGKSNTAGNIMIAGKTETNLIGSLISVEGLNVGGMINLGQINNLGNGTILAPPATAPPALITFVHDSVAAATSNNATSITSSNINIDSQTGINAPNGNIVVFGDQIQVNNSSITATNGTIAIGREAYSAGALAALAVVSNSTLIANRVETSGAWLGTENNTIRALEWLLDPNNVTITAAATTGGTLPNYNASLTTSNVNTVQIQNAINAGTSVTIVANGTITQSAALAFAPATGVSATLTLDNRTSAASVMTISAATTNSGAGTVSLVYLSSGAITLGAITSTNGKINVTAQSTKQIAVSSNINVNGNITTRGGDIVLDGTGGTINGTTITRAPNLPSGASGAGGGVVFDSTATVAVTINTTTDGGAVGAATTGGVLNIASSGTLGMNLATLNIGGSVDMNIVGGNNGTTGAYGFLSDVNTSPMIAKGNINIYLNSINVNTNFWARSPITSYSGSVTIYATEIQAGNPSINLEGAISGYAGVSLTSVAGALTAKAIITTALGTLTSATGTVTVSGTTQQVANNQYAVNLGGAISAPKVVITGANTSTAGKAVNSTAPITITADPSISFLTTPGDALTITGNVATTGIAGGINLSAAATITNNSNGGNVTMVTAGDLTALGAVNFATANTTNHSQTITYDTRTGNTTSLITTGAFTYNATGATEKVNYVVESNGSNLTVGATAVSGYINIDNTCPSCITPLTPASAAASMTTSAAITVSGALSSGDYIYLNGLNNSATLNAVVLGASTLTITSASTATDAITVIGNHNAANKGNVGIASSGAIVNQSSAGGNISFTSNGDITQSGALTLSANNSGHSQTVTYDTTTGNLNSSITAGVLTAATGTSPLNYIERSSGSGITAGALTISGFVNLDNTYGCAGVGCTPVSGYINTNTEASTLAVQAENGIYISGSISADSFTANAINYPTSTSVTYPAFALGKLGNTTPVITTVGDILITGIGAGTSLNSGVDIRGGMISTAGDITLTGTNYSPIYGSLNIWNGPIRAAGALTMTANAYNTSNFPLYIDGKSTSAIQGASVTLTANEYSTAANASTTAGAIFSANAIQPIIATNGDITITTNVANKANDGINLSGPIIQNTSGGDITFSANSTISQTGPVTLVGNTSGAVSSVTYDTTRGNNVSTITSGPLTVNSASTDAINFIEKSTGAALTVGAISIPGYISLDNTYGGTAGAGGTPTSGFITYANASTLATVATGISINGALSTGAFSGPQAITVFGVSAGPTVTNGVSVGATTNTSASLTAATGSINVTGITKTGDKGIVAYAPMTATNGNINLIGITGSTSTTAALAEGVAIMPAANLTASGVGAGNITIAGSVLSTANTGNGIRVDGLATGGPTIINASGTLTFAGYDAATGATAAHSVYIARASKVYLKSGLDTIIAGSIPGGTGGSTGANISLGVNSGTIGVVINAGRDLIIEGAVLTTQTNSSGASIPNVATPSANSAALAGATGGIAIEILNQQSYVDGGVNYTGFNAVRNIWMHGIGGEGGIADNGVPLTSTTGNITLLGTAQVTSKTAIKISSSGSPAGTGAILAKDGVVTITGNSIAGASGYAVWDAAPITGNAIIVTGNASGLPTTIVSLGVMTINACAAGVDCTSHDLEVYAWGGGAQTSVTNTGSTTGITQTGAIAANANGGSILFKSNNVITQGGAITIAQNTSGTDSLISYDTTFGTRLSSIDTGPLTFNGTSTNYINYNNIASGAPIIVNAALTVPGSITFDNTYLNGVQGGINTNNAWQYATIAPAAKGIYVSASLTASDGIYIRGAIGASTALVASCCNAVSLDGTFTLQTVGSFATGNTESAIEIIGIQPIANMTATTIQNAIELRSNVSLINNSINGKINIVAISGHYKDIVSITSASTAGSIDVSAIGLNAQVYTVAGTLFTQNSNAGIFIATSENGNVLPPKIVNNGTGPVVIAAGTYFPVGTVNTSCSVGGPGSCGQIYTVSGNNITSPNGNVFLYAGSPGTGTINSLTSQSMLSYLDSRLGNLTFANTLFGQAYAVGNVPATLIPIDAIAALNTANAAPGTGYTSYTTSATTSTNGGPVIQFRIQPSVQANLSGNVTKVYGADDPLATSGNLATVGSLDYQLNALFVKNATVNPGYVANGATGCLNQPSGCMKTTVNGLNFFLPMDDFINSLQATLPTPRASYGTVPGEQVNGTSSTAFTSSYAYNLSSTHGVMVSSGISVNLQPASGSVGLVITPAPLTITASNQTIQAGDAFTAGTTAFTTSGLALAPNGVVLADAISGVTLAAPTYTGQTTAGAYAINASAPVFSTGSASNYTITYAPGTLTTTTNLIITITALAESKIYGSSAISSPSSITYNGSGVAVVSGPASALYTITGLPVGGTYTIDSLTFTSAGGIASASVGGSPYTVTPSAVSITTASGSPSIAGASYIYQPGLMTVTPRPITITATPVTTTYGSATPITQTGYTASNNLVAGDTITGATVNYVGASTSTTVPGTLGAGTYSSAIVPSAATGTGGFNSTNYAITYAPADLVVNKLAVIVTANAQSTVYGTALALGTTAFTNSIGTLPNGDAITAATLQYNGLPSVPATTNAGSYTIAASAATGTGGFGSANYDVTYATGPLTVTPAPITISATAPTQSVVYSGSAQTFNAATGLTISGLKNGETAVLGTTGLGSGTNVGVYTNTVDANLITSITGGNALLSNYTVTYSGAQAALNIIPAPLSITGAFTSAVYDAAAHTNAAPTVSGLKGSDAVALPMGVLGMGTNAGTYADVLAPVFTTGSANNYTITTTNGALTITPKAATVTGNTIVNQYSGALQTNTYTTTGIITGDAVTVGGVATATHVSQGTVPDVFTVSGPSAGNYTFTYAPGSITITPAPLTVTGAITTAVYNKTTQTNTAANVTGLLGSDTATIGGTYGSGINAGVYTDSLSVGLSNPSDYSVSITNGTHTITPAIITVNGITAQNKVYDATTAATLNVGTITTTGVLPGDTVTLQTSTLSGVFTDKNVGNGKTVLISGVVLAGTDSANYQLSGGANTATTANITPAPLTITGADLTTTYNASVQSLAAPTVAGLIAGDNVTVAGNATGTNVGSYSATYTASGVDAGNYTVTANTPVLTINKANLVVTANNAGKFYGQADPAFTATIAGLQGSDTATVNAVTSSVTGTTAATGTYPTAINASGVTSTNLANYNVTYVPGAYTITPAGVLVITMNAATTTYGTAASPTVATIQFATGTGINTTVVTLTKSGDTYTDGAYSITVTPAITDQGVTPVVTGASTTWNVGAYTNAVSNTNNYNQTGSPFTGVTTITNTLTITPAPLAIIVASTSKTYNASAFTAAQASLSSVTGLLNGDTISGYSGVTAGNLGGVTFSGSSIGAINASATTYPINGSVGSGFSNYNVTITNGALTINQAPLVVNGAVTTTQYNGATQTNAAATVTGLQGSDSVVVSGYATATHVSQGIVPDVLVASGASASNYSITYNNGSIAITPASLLVTGVANQYAYNGALQTNTGASVSGLKGTDTATVAGYATATHVSQGIVPDALVATLQSANTADYTVTYVQGSLQITPIVITAVVNSATVMYNANSQTTGFVVTGLKGSDIAAAASGTATGTNAGTYTSNLVLTTSSDYTVGAITNGTLTITPAPLTISAGLTANNKVYDTTTAATIAVTGNQVLEGVLGVDAVTVSSTGPYTGATFSQSNVGSGLTVTPGTSSTVINGVTYTTMAGVTLTGAAAGNYYVAGVGPQTLTGNITPRPITIATGLTASDKVYDATTAATITSATQTLSGVLPSDSANVSVSSNGPYTGTFSQSNVGAGLTVTPTSTATTIAGASYDAMTGVTLSGSAAGNYYVTGTTSPITASITPYIINFGAGGTGPNITAVANNKVYTSTTSANGTLAMVNLFGTDSVDVTFTSASFANPNVANSIPVTFSGVTLSGASAGNYALGNTPITSSANITQAPLTITAIDKASFYTQATADLTQAYAPAVGLLGADVVTGATVTTTATNTSAVGTYPISIGSATGTGLSNYSITYVPATYTIVGPGGLLISTTGVTTPYGTGTSGNIIAPALPTASYILGGSNSSLTYVSSSTTGNVTRYVFKDVANVTVTFDLTPSNTSTSGSGNINIGSYPYATSNLSAGSTGLTSAIPSGNFTVTPLAITITASPETHAYNGSVQIQASATSSPAIKTNDIVTITGSALGKNVGTYGSSLSATGADIANYSITYVNADLTITPYILGSGGAGTPAITATANNKVYETTTVATGSLAMANLFAGDTVAANYANANFATPNVANGLTVTFGGVTLSGPDAANYAVGSSPITATANITPAPLTISAGLTANNKVYDTTTAATIAVTGNQVLEGVLGVDAVTVSSTGPYTGATFSQSNVGSGLTVTPGTSSTVINGVTYTTMAGVTLTGAAAGNYYVAGVGPQTLTANITPAPLTISAGLTANNKAYDGTTAATITAVAGAQTLVGLVGSDISTTNVVVSSSGAYTGNFSQSNVGNNLVVTPTTTATVIAGASYNAMADVTLSGISAGNYYVTGTTSPIRANITPYIIVPGVTTGPAITAVANNKVYTSTDGANGTLAMVNLFGTDSVSISYTGATFASPNVANGITVTFTGAALSGPSAANYSIGAGAITATANITPAPLTVTANDQASLYTQPLVTLSVASAIGLLGGQQVTGATLATTAATSGPNSSAGAYPISISAATGASGFIANNYTISYVPATYTIVPAGQLLVSTSGLTTIYGSTVVSGNIVTPSINPTLSYLTTGGAVISNLTYVSKTVTGNVVTYNYVDGSSHTVSFNLTPTGTSTSTSGNINVGSYSYAATNVSAPGTGLSSTSGVATGDLVVTPLALTITAPITGPLTYNGTNQNQGAVTYSTPILSTTGVGTDQVNVSGLASGKNVGIYGSNLAVSGADTSNYAITLVNNNLTITPFVITPGSTSPTDPRLTTAANNKVYDTTTAATGSLAMINLFAGDSVAVNYASAAFASANVNSPSSPQTVTFSGVTLSGASANNYTIGSGAITATANITPAPVTISGLVAQNKVYTSTSNAVITGTPIVTGLLGSDASTATGTAVGTFVSPNVANSISVAADLSGMTLSNPNYVITGLTAPLAANITPAPLTISSGLFAQNKVYDITTVATIAAIGAQTLEGVLGSDAANLAVSSSGPYTGSFSQANVGNGLTVSQATATAVINGKSYTTMAGATLSGSAAGNYYVTGPTSALTANITKAPLTITAINQASFVTQPIGALTYASIGLLGSDAISAVTLATAASNTQPAGQYAITASNATGAAIGNYQVTYVPGTYTIVPAGQLLIHSSGAVTPYTTAPTFANPTVAYATSGGAIINNLYLTASSTVNGITTYTYSDGAGASLIFNFAPTNPVMSGSNNVSVGTYGLSAANFAITGNNITNISPVVTGDLTVTPRAITITATPATYVYNGTVRVLANTTSTPGIVAGDLVTVVDTTAGKNVGNYFSALATTGADSINYQTSFINANLSITPYVLGSIVGGPAISPSANNRVYNTTTGATGSLAMTGLFPGDVVTADFTNASFASPNANNGITVTFNSVTLSGAAAANYVLGAAPVSTTANITKAPVTISGLLAQNKVFDGTPAAVITGNPVIAGLLGSDVSTLSGAVLAGLFASSNPADRILVKAILDALILGNPNYYIAGVTFPLVADITSPPQTINNMAIVQQQVAQDFVQDRPTDHIKKGELIYVRDKDNLPEYLQAIEVPSTGAFKFPVPDSIIQDLINLSGENAELAKQAGSYKLLLLPKGSKLVVTLPDGAALPAGIMYDTGTNTFVVPKLGNITLPLSVKVTLMRGKQTLSQKIMVVTK